jgi:hypothetical protein
LIGVAVCRFVEGFAVMDEEASGPRLPRDHPLAGCEAKIWRAHEHFERLKKEIHRLGSGEFHPATFRTELKPDAKDTFWTVVETATDPPLEISTIIGDVVHNLRSSLDHLVFELAFLGLRGRVPRKRTASLGASRGRTGCDPRSRESCWPA